VAGVESQNSRKEIEMKSIISFVVVAALSFVASAIAQEESPSPAAEQKASATVEETPAATVAPESKPTATPQEKIAGQKKAAAPSAEKPAKKMSVEAALKDNENRWEAAYAAHDLSTVESLLANDFAGVYWDGKTMNRSSVISEFKKDKDTYKSAKNEKLAVHMYGPNIAVVVGTAHEIGTSKDGKPFDRTFRFTDTWMERNGRWQCVASQVMKVRG
jgi:ketosteroid isomerase-like protein